MKHHPCYLNNMYFVSCCYMYVVYFCTYYSISLSLSLSLSDMRYPYSPRPLDALNSLQIYWHKQETSALHLCLLIPNACRHFIQMFCFNNVDYSTMVCAKQKSIRWTLVPMTTPQAPVPKFRKSQNQYLVYSSCFNHPSITEQTRCWDFMSARCIPYCHDHWHKSDTCTSQNVDHDRRYTQTLPCWSISLKVNGIGLLQNSFLAINSIEISIIQHRKKLVTKLLDYFSVRGTIIKPGFSKPGFQISGLNFIFWCMLSLSYTRIAN